MIPTRDDMFHFLDSVSKHGHDIHDESSEILAMMFCRHLSLPDEGPLFFNLALDHYSLWVDTWKEQTTAVCC